MWLSRTHSMQGIDTLFLLLSALCESGIARALNFDLWLLQMTIYMVNIQLFSVYTKAKVASCQRCGRNYYTFIPDTNCQMPLCSFTKNHSCYVPFVTTTNLDGGPAQPWAVSRVWRAWTPMINDIVIYQWGLFWFEWHLMSHAHLSLQDIHWFPVICGLSWSFYHAMLNLSLHDIAFSHDCIMRYGTRLSACTIPKYCLHASAAFLGCGLPKHVTIPSAEI